MGPAGAARNPRVAAAALRGSGLPVLAPEEELPVACDQDDREDEQEAGLDHLAGRVGPERLVEAPRREWNPMASRTLRCDL